MRWEQIFGTVYLVLYIAGLWRFVYFLATGPERRK